MSFRFLSSISKQRALLQTHLKQKYKLYVGVSLGLLTPIMWNILPEKHDSFKHFIHHKLNTHPVGYSHIPSEFGWRSYYECRLCDERFNSDAWDPTSNDHKSSGASPLHRYQQNEAKQYWSKWGFKSWSQWQRLTMMNPTMEWILFLEREWILDCTKMIEQRQAAHMALHQSGSH